jgi:hypothetical protein
MDANRTRYARRYHGPDDEAAYQQWLRANWAESKRRFVRGYVIAFLVTLGVIAFALLAMAH